MIEVETEDCKTLAPVDTLEFLLEPLAQENAIGQIRQRIVPRHVRDALFDATSFGDVLVGRQPAAACYRRVHDGEDAPIWRFGDVGRRLSLCNHGPKPGDVTLPGTPKR